MQTDGEIVLVRHGAGRGRIGNYLWHVLKDIHRHDRALSRRIRLHYTGEVHPELNNARAVVFWLADPLREHYPECFAEANAIANEAHARGIRIVNSPDALSNSIKSVQYRLWTEAGIPTPPQFHFTSMDELRGHLKETTYPAFIRSDEHHAQSNMILLAREEDVASIPNLERNPHLFPGTVTPLVDTREAYRATAPGTPWAEYYHKKRVLVCGEHTCPIHLYFSEEPMVGVPNSTFRVNARGGSKGLLGRLTARGQSDASVQADCAYGSAETEFPDLMRSAAKALGLEFAAIDYSTHADGRPVLWEANPYFVLRAWRQSVLPRERDLKRRYQRIYATVRNFFHDLLLNPVA